MLPRMHGLWPRDNAGGSRAGSHPRIPPAEPPPQKAGPHWEARRVHVKGGGAGSAMLPFGIRLARRVLGCACADTQAAVAGPRGKSSGRGSRACWPWGRKPWGTGAKEGRFGPPPSGPHGSRGDPGIADRHVPTAPNPPGVGADSHGPPFAGVLPAALARRHPCTNYTRLRRRTSTARHELQAGQAAGRRRCGRRGRLAAEAPPAGRRRAARRRRGPCA